MMSALTQEAGIDQRRQNVRFVPKADKPPFSYEAGQFSIESVELETELSEQLIRPSNTAIS